MRASAVVNWGSTWRELAWTGTPSLPRCSTPPIAWWPLGGGQVERGADVVTHADPYDHLWARLGRHLPWITTQQVSTHWLRHTTLTWVERHHGYAVARAYAGHDGGRDIGVTATYVRADIAEVAAALAAFTGEPHPLTADADGVGSTARARSTAASLTDVPAEQPVT